MRLRTLFLVAAIALFASACTPMTFLGDSITAQSTADINAHDGQNYVVTVDAAVGVDTYLWAPHVAAAAATKPHIAIINLGTNDAQRMGTAFPGDPAQTVEEVNARYDQFAAEFPTTTCVIFVTINTHNPSWGPVAAEGLNAHLRTFAHVVDWDAAWVATDYDVADNPHPNEQGRQHLLALEDAAIAACP